MNDNIFKKDTIVHIWPTPETEKDYCEKYPDIWARYKFCERYVKHQTVVDCACSSGFGSNILLSYGAKEVFGFDIEEESLNWAKKYYNKPSLSFKHYEEIKNFKNESINVVVSLETIEHVDNPDQFLVEIKKILKKDGILIISTPCNQTDNRLSPSNLFHLREYNWEEFDKLISKYFTVQNRFSQVSQLGKLNNKLTSSPLFWFKKIIPKSIKKILIKTLTNKSAMKSGEILPGFIENASVQIIVAVKKF